MIYKIFHEDISDEKLLPFVVNSAVYQKSTLQNCDFIIHNEVLWDKANTPEILKLLSKKYRSVRRFVIVLIVSDFEERYKAYPNLIVLRTSLKQSLKRENELVLPYVWEHLDEPFLPISTAQASIGFCGLVSPHREAIINCFKQSPGVKANFILRDKFWGGEPHNVKIIDDFNNNLLQNPFIIAQRGNGNFSMRFYQTLAAGRIPVLVNTDMVLPFADTVDWDKIIVFGKNEQECLKKVIRVFESGEYVQMQRYGQLVFKAYFSKSAFLEKILEEVIRLFNAK